MKIIAFFEKGTDNELLGVFNPEIYGRIFPALEKIAKEKGMKLTEAEVSNEEGATILKNWKG